jgi:hypothetical protein
MRKLFFSTGTIGLMIAVAALFAWSHAVTPLQATTASSSTNPTEVMAPIRLRYQSSSGTPSENSFSIVQF